MEPGVHFSYHIAGVDGTGFHFSQTMQWISFTDVSSVVIVTEGSHPAVLVTSDPNDSIEFVSVSPHSNLVAVATKQGVLSIWDVSGSLCILVSVLRMHSRHD